MLYKTYILWRYINTTEFVVYTWRDYAKKLKTFPFK
jgi:hypothetical protein